MSNRKPHEEIPPPSASEPAKEKAASNTGFTRRSMLTSIGAAGIAATVTITAAAIAATAARPRSAAATRANAAAQALAES